MSGSRGIILACAISHRLQAHLDSIEVDPVTLVSYSWVLAISAYVLVTSRLLRLFVSTRGCGGRNMYILR